VYDNSHLQGDSALGAMIVVGVDGFQKSAYRRFNHSGRVAETRDDYAMMRAMLHRRLKEFKGGAVKEGEDAEAVMPQLLLIDGGKGQLAAAVGVLEELGLQQQIAVIAIAKGVERNKGLEQFFVPDLEKGGGAKTVELADSDPLRHFLQRVRDEAHRFAITGNRAGRRKKANRSVLDDMPGIGAARRQALLQHFGSLRLLTQASSSDLAAVKGISKTLATQLHRHLHPEQG
jgi:excinuclease ABC subunit C